MFDISSFKIELEKFKMICSTSNSFTSIEVKRFNKSIRLIWRRLLNFPTEPRKIDNLIKDIIFFSEILIKNGNFHSTPFLKNREEKFFLQISNFNLSFK
jgi:hypothetical protein